MTSSPLTVDEALQQALAHHQAGRLQDAEQLYRAILQGVPHHADAHHYLGDCLAQQQRYEEAAACYDRTLQLNPQNVAVLFNLAHALIQLGQFAAAATSYHRVLELLPDCAEAHYALGVVAEAMSQLAEAEAGYCRALELKPDYADAHNNLGVLCARQGRFTEAEACYNHALTLNPNYVATYHNLSDTLRRQGRFDEAEACCRRALELKPDYFEVHNNLGNVFKDQDIFADAETCYRQALAINPDYTDALSNLGFVLKDTSQFAEAEACYRRALEITPNSTDAHGNLLFTLNYHPDLTGEEIYADYRAFDARFCLPLRAEWRPHVNPRDPGKRLKIGYVCPSFHRHSTRHFLEPLLAHHDKQEFEIYAYAEMIKPPDDVTARYQSYVDHWVPTRGMSDAELAERIRADGMDILVDIAGHTGGNRLQVFARKPAPVSLHWLDFGYTTGLTAIDYYLTDHPTVPAGAEHLFAETPWRLPVPALVYRPESAEPQVQSPLPYLERGHITLGTLSRAVRINDKVIRVWSAILQALPGARLVINSRDFHDPAMQALMTQRFARHGITPDRLDIGASPASEVLRGVDIGLDCFPHNSGTTLFEMLYLGIPFVTLAGRSPVGTLGASVLHGLGHPEWIVETEAEYIERVVSLASNPQQLAWLRSTLPGEMKCSPLMDEAGFTRAVEAAYRTMWQTWCTDSGIG